MLCKTFFRLFPKKKQSSLRLLDRSQEKDSGTLSTSQFTDNNDNN